MRIHPTDPAAIAKQVPLNTLTWKEIMQRVAERAAWRDAVMLYKGEEYHD